jgi:hypothetical protein
MSSLARQVPDRDATRVTLLLIPWPEQDPATDLEMDCQMAQTLLNASFSGASLVGHQAE